MPLIKLKKNSLINLISLILMLFIQGKRRSIKGGTLLYEAAARSIYLGLSFGVVAYK